MAEAELTVEKLTEDQLTERRAKRFLALQTLKPDTEVGRVLLKNVQQQLMGVTWAEDVLVAMKGLAVEDRHQEKFKMALAWQRKAVKELTGVYNELRMQVEFGAEAVVAVFHGAESYDDMSEEQVQRFKEMAKSKEKEKEQLKQQQLKMEQQQHFWLSGRGRGSRQTPYYYGGRPQYYGGGATAAYGQYAAGGAMMMPQYGYSQPGVLSAAMGQQAFVQQPVVAQQAPVMQQQMMSPVLMPAGSSAAGGSYVPSTPRTPYAPPALTRGGGLGGLQARSRAICYACGEPGHFAKDGICEQSNVDAFQAYYSHYTN